MCRHTPEQWVQVQILPIEPIAGVRFLKSPFALAPAQRKEKKMFANKKENYFLEDSSILTVEYLYELLDIGEGIKHIEVSKITFRGKTIWRKEKDDD